MQYLGVAALYFISGSIDIEETAINKISSGQSDGEVVVSGKVARITDKDTFTFTFPNRDVKGIDWGTFLMAK